MVNFKEDERLNTLNHSCAHVMAQAVKHLYPHAKFWVGPVVKEGFYYDIDLGDDVINDEAIEAIEKEMKKICKEGKKIYRREVSKEEALEMFKDDMYKLDLISQYTPEYLTSLKMAISQFMTRAISQTSVADLMLIILSSARTSSLLNILVYTGREMPAIM